MNIENFAKPAYLDYAMKTVLDRAIPDIEDGLKPVQRRILYSMYKLKLNHLSKPVKSARVVGNTIGLYHPHGDSSVYEAMVRMSQPFNMRYPLVLGEGNFGSRDGDSPAAMRYTEAKLTSLASCLLDELDSNTVDFQPNYDNSEQEPVLLPARLPFALLNGTTGIAVGMQTNLLSHNLNEVVEACKLILTKTKTTLDDILHVMPGPDLATGGQIISSADDIKKMYKEGKGSLRVRGKWSIDYFGKNKKEWKCVVSELPPETNTGKFIGEIEELVNPTPKEKKGKKQPLTAEQTRLKKLFGDMIDEVIDGRDKDHPLNIIIHPKKNVDPQTLTLSLCTYTSLESNLNPNFVFVDLVGNPHRSSLLDWLTQWCQSRYTTYHRRIEFEKQQIEHRLHILEGRLNILDHIEEVIRVLKKSKEPKKDLMEIFHLDDIQADDVLEMRLRQLAGLEKEKILLEKTTKEKELERLKILLSDEKLMKKEIIKELDRDKKTFGDERRTLLQEDTPIVTPVVSFAPEPIAVALTERGWISWKSVKTQNEVVENEFKIKTGDHIKQMFLGDRGDFLALITKKGRAYSLSLRLSELDGKSDTLPLTQFFDLEKDDFFVTGVVLNNTHKALVSSSDGYGFIVQGSSWINRMKAGKSFLTLSDKGLPLKPILLPSNYQELSVLTLTSEGLSVAFPLSDVPELIKGKGVAFMNVQQSVLQDICLYSSDNPPQFIFKNKNVKIEETALKTVYNKRSSSKKGKNLYKNASQSTFL